MELTVEVRTGVPSVIEFLYAIGNPAREELTFPLKPIEGPFDPSAFDLEEIDERLAKIKL